MDIPTISPYRAAALERSGASRPSGTAATTLTFEIAKYINPRMSFDPDTGRIVVQIRDSATGEVREQYRPDQVADAYGRTKAVRADQPEPVIPAEPAAADPAARGAKREAGPSSIPTVERAVAPSQNRLDSLVKSV